jgi:uncharacterized protein (DUF488 family)
MKIFTIGYGGRTPTDFIASLTASGIRCVADVRFSTRRAFLNCYAKANTPEKGIEGLLARSGIQYRWFSELGNEWRDAPGWEENYRSLLERDGEKRTERLRLLPEPFCLLCGEKDPRECHRSILAEYLARNWPGSEIAHL